MYIFEGASIPLETRVSKVDGACTTWNEEVRWIRQYLLLIHFISYLSDHFRWRRNVAMEIRGGLLYVQYSKELLERGTCWWSYVAAKNLSFLHLLIKKRFESSIADPCIEWRSMQPCSWSNRWKSVSCHLINQICWVKSTPVIVREVESEMQQSNLWKCSILPILLKVSSSFPNWYLSIQSYSIFELVHSGWSVLPEMSKGRAWAASCVLDGILYGMLW